MTDIELDAIRDRVECDNKYYGDDAEKDRAALLAEVVRLRGLLTTADPNATLRAALLSVAKNVAKHVVQRSGWSEDDQCFEVDLTAAEESLRGLLATAKRAGAAEAWERAIGLLRQASAGLIGCSPESMIESLRDYHLHSLGGE